MKSLFDIFAGLVLGSGPLAFIFQYVFLLLMTLLQMRRIILWRIGSLNAVIVLSYPRLCIALIICNLVFLAGYHLALLTNPSASWIRFILFCFVISLSYLFCSPIVTLLGAALDLGRALRVVTSRYKSSPQRGLIDLTEDFGKHAQLIPRGAIASYVALILLSLIITFIERIRHSLATLPPKNTKVIPLPIAIAIISIVYLGIILYFQLVKPFIRKRKIAALGVGRKYWSAPHGEPEWLTIPAGEFWMGSDARVGIKVDLEAQPAHRIFLPEFRMARVPITNIQYHLFVCATGVQPPQDWIHGQLPMNQANHPVLYVSWYEACKYCEWLSTLSGKLIRLPTEAEWEKGARGLLDQRKYPWGNNFASARCNTKELTLNSTSPVGIFTAGASPNGCLDMAGNVFEWTSSLWGNSPYESDFRYPYNSTDGREYYKAPDEVRRIVRGGSFAYDRSYARCSARFGLLPNSGYFDVGFRVVTL